MQIIKTPIEGVVILEPRGIAVLSDITIFQYKCDNYYHPESVSYYVSARKFR